MYEQVAQMRILLANYYARTIKKRTREIGSRK